MTIVSRVMQQASSVLGRASQNSPKSSAELVAAISHPSSCIVKNVVSRAWQCLQMRYGTFLRMSEFCGHGCGISTVGSSCIRSSQKRQYASSALREREYWVNRSSSWGGGSSWRPSNNFSVDSLSGERAVQGLISMNVLVFGLWQLAGNSTRSSHWSHDFNGIRTSSGFSLRHFMTNHFVCSDDFVFRQWRFHTLLTAAFSHIEPFHLFGNMLALYFFGRSVGSHLGGRRLLTLYATAGIIGNVGHILYHRVIDGRVSFGAFLSFLNRFKSAESDDHTRRRSMFHAVRQVMSPKVLGASAAVNSLVAFDILCSPMKIIMVNFFIPMPAAVLGMIMNSLVAHLFILLSLSGLAIIPIFLNCAPIGGMFLARDLFYAFNVDGTHFTRESHAAHIAGAGVGTTLFFYLRRIRRI